MKLITDSSLNIREKVLDVLKVLLSCSKNYIAVEILLLAQKLLTHAILYDSNTEIRKQALFTLYKLFQHKPFKVFQPRSFKTLYHVCLDKNRTIRLFAYVVATSIYLTLMKRFSKDIYHLPQVARIAGLLTEQFKTVDEVHEKKILYRQLSRIKSYFESTSLSKK